MKSYVKYYLGLILPLIILSMASAASAQNARLNFEKLDLLESRARDIVEVNIDGKLLALAKRAMVKVNDKDAKRIGEAIKGLEAVYVRVYRFEKENEYNPADIEEIRAQLNSPGWERIANVRSKKNNQKVDVFTAFTGDTMSGLAVVVSEAKSIALINVIGPIDIEMLAEMSGNWNIPKIDIIKENGSENKDKPQ